MHNGSRVWLDSYAGDKVQHFFIHIYITETLNVIEDKANIAGSI